MSLTRRTIKRSLSNSSIASVHRALRFVVEFESRDFF
jgi:hypothetical protein